MCTGWGCSVLLYAVRYTVARVAPFSAFSCQPCCCQGSKGRVAFLPVNMLHFLLSFPLQVFRLLHMQMCTITVSALTPLCFSSFLTKRPILGGELLCKAVYCFCNCLLLRSMVTYLSKTGLAADFV